MMVHVIIERALLCVGGVVLMLMYVRVCVSALAMQSSWSDGQVKVCFVRLSASWKKSEFLQLAWTLHTCVCTGLPKNVVMVCCCSCRRGGVQVGAGRAELLAAQDLPQGVEEGDDSTSGKLLGAESCAQEWHDWLHGVVWPQRSLLPIVCVVHVTHTTRVMPCHALTLCTSRFLQLLGGALSAIVAVELSINDLAVPLNGGTRVNCATQNPPQACLDVRTGLPARCRPHSPTLYLNIGPPGI